MKTKCLITFLSKIHINIFKISDTIFHFIRFFYNKNYSVLMKVVMNTKSHETEHCVKPHLHYISALLYHRQSHSHIPLSHQLFIFPAHPRPL